MASVVVPFFGYVGVIYGCLLIGAVTGYLLAKDRDRR
jgi:hypothetical protein